MGVRQQCAHLGRNHLIPRPGTRDGAGVLTCKQHCNKQSSDLILCELTATAHILVTGIAKLLQNVLMFGGAGCAARADDRRKNLAQSAPCSVAAGMESSGEVGEEHADGPHAIIQVMEQVCDLQPAKTAGGTRCTTVCATSSGER